jgi:aldose 1-epimerase
VTKTQDDNAATDTLVELAAGELRVALTPAVGGSIAGFSRRWSEGGREREVQWLRPASPEGLAARNPLAMASFPLVPFCNRIRDGHASFEGREIRFPPNHPGEPSPHPLHGIGWLLPWQVFSSTATEAVLVLQVEASAAWPWRFSAAQHFALDEGGLVVSMVLTNEDTAAMPAGIGHHPYFPHEPGTRITSPAEAMWEADGEVMPTGLTRVGAVERLREGVEVRAIEQDNNFTGWEHRTLVEWPADAQRPARSVSMEAEAPLDFFVLYSPRQYAYFCAEPVSQCTDWLNLMPAYGPEVLGGARVAPGESLTARFTLRPQWEGR